MANYTPFGGFDPYGDMNQQQQQQQNQQQQNSPCFEGYDPSVATAPAPYTFNGGTAAVNNVNTAPPFMPSPFGLDGHSHLSVSSNHVSQHQTHSRGTSHNKNEIHTSTVPNMSPSTTTTTTTTFARPMMAYSTIFDAPQLSLSNSQQADPAKPAPADKWLDTISISVSGVSLEPLLGSQLLTRVRTQTDKVVTCYLPCVEFLVNCQQELRVGLATATQKKLVRHAYRDAMTPRQFYNRYLAPLQARFHRRNVHLMEADVLSKATQEIASLCKDAQKVQNQGHEAMKNAFLGGMQDGESWGLRKWLSRNGGALHICNDLECILNACQKLERGEETTRKLAERLRPLAKQAHTRLKSDVPPSYQEISSAHPYLPFFHRLESALKSMSTFDPEDDDVICIDDDDEIEQVKAKAVAKKPKAKKKRPAVLESDLVEPFAKRARTSFEPLTFGGFGRDGTPPIKNPFDSDGDDSVIEILGVKPPPGSDNSSLLNAGVEGNDHWRCARCSMLNVVCSNHCCMCGKNREQEQTCPAQETDDDMLDTFSELAGLASFEDAASSVAAKIFDLPDPSSIHNQRPSSLSQTNHSAPATEMEQQFAPPPDAAKATMTANEMIQHLEHLAYLFEINKQDLVRPRTVESEGFWDASGERYARILRLFVSLIHNVDCEPFLHPVNPQQMNASYVLYSNYIKNPLCFQDIVYSLVDLDQAQKSDGAHQPCGTGILPGMGLARWNMWRGFDLLQAIDLVLLNSLAFHGKERTRERSATNRVRKRLWDEIHRITVEYFGSGADEARRKATPTRRGETSGFVVRKS